MGPTSLPLIGDSFMYIETSSKNHGGDVSFSFEGVDIFQKNNITFYHNRFFNLNIDSKKSMSRFSIQLCLANGQWSSKHKFERKLKMKPLQLIELY